MFFATALQNLIGQNMRGNEKELPLLLFNKNKSKPAHIVPPIWNKKAQVIVLLKIARSQAKQVVYALHFLPSQTFGRRGYQDRHFKEKIHRLQIEMHNVRMRSEFLMAGGALNYPVVTVRCGRQKRL